MASIWNSAVLKSFKANVDIIGGNVAKVFAYKLDMNQVVFLVQTATYTILWLASLWNHESRLWTHVFLWN